MRLSRTAQAELLSLVQTKGRLRVRGTTKVMLVKSRVFEQAEQKHFLEMLTLKLLDPLSVHGVFCLVVTGVRWGFVLN